MRSSARAWSSTLTPSQTFGSGQRSGAARRMIAFGSRFAGSFVARATAQKLRATTAVGSAGVVT
jgi:hypothetical protein